MTIRNKKEENLFLECEECMNILINNYIEKQKVRDAINLLNRECKIPDLRIIQYRMALNDIKKELGL